jgi:Ca2+-transporting ATPase
MLDPATAGRTALRWDDIAAGRISQDSTYFVREDQAQPFDAAAAWQEGDTIPRRILRLPQASRADIAVSGQARWADGPWDVTLRRRMATGQPSEDQILRDGGAYQVAFAMGMRVLAVARATHQGPDLPASQEAFAFSLLGLVGLADPLRPGVAAAVAECRTAGIRVVMIAGDYPATAAAIARAAGLDADTIIDGGMLADMDDATLATRARGTTVFARIMPAQKLRIVEALKADGKVVAMTGDGVNDAPSLKAAHIGIAMGGRGTDVAREASSLVLPDDDFGSIVGAIRLGRRVFDNLRKSMGFIIAIHVPIAGMALLPLVFGLPILLWPMHIAFLEMVIDPVCTLVFEAETEEEGIMRRPPREPSAPLFSASLLGWSVMQGLVALALTAGIFVVALEQGMAEAAVRSLTFFALVMSIVGLILVNRSFSTSIATALTRRDETRHVQPGARLDLNFAAQDALVLRAA